LIQHHNPEVEEDHKIDIFMHKLSRIAKRKTRGISIIVFDPS